MPEKPHGEFHTDLRHKMLLHIVLYNKFIFETSGTMLDTIILNDHNMSRYNNNILVYNPLRDRFHCQLMGYGMSHFLDNM